MGFHCPITPFISKSVTFTGASGLGEAATTTTLFTVTGQIFVIYLVPYTVATLTQSAGTPNLALGVVNAPAFFIGATTATALLTGEFWTEATGAGVASAASGIPSALTAPALRDIAVASNIIGTVGGTNNISGGTLRFDLYWLPLSSDGSVA